MNISIFSNLFKKKEHSIPKGDSVVLQQLRAFASEKGLLLFENIPVFYRSKQMNVPLALFVPRHGLVLFEYKSWSFKELKDAQISKASHVEKKEESLAFENLLEFIQEKFIDTSDFEDIDIFNFVILENLKTDEFNLLDESFHQLLPKSRILFGDTTKEDMEQKFNQLNKKLKTYTAQNTLPYIFGQYLVPSNDAVYFANEQQREFIDKPLQSDENIHAARRSGASTVILQKALLEHFANPTKKISIFTPTKLHAILLQKKLLDILEYTTVVIDMDKIEILTQEQFFASIEALEKSHKTAFGAGDIVIIDDAFAFDPIKLLTLKENLKNARSIFINDMTQEATFHLEKSYYGEVEFIQANGIVTAMKEISHLLYKYKTAETMLISANADDDAFVDDIESYTGREVHPIDFETPVEEKKFRPIQLSGYDTYNPVYSDYVFLIDCCEIDVETLEYFAKSSKKKTFIIYEEPCDTITQLQNIIQSEENGKDC